MDQIAFSRKISSFTILALLEAIAQDEAIAPKRRADICSGVRSLCRSLHLQPESTLADPRLFAELLAKATPASLQMGKGRFQNCQSHLDAALAYADALFHRKRSRTPLAPPSVPMEMRHRPAGSLALRAEVTSSDGYARFDS